MLRHLTHAWRLARYAIHHAFRRRSPLWPTVKREHLEAFPMCAACGGSVRLNVHHVVPFHIDPERELDRTNLLTLCMALDRHCHLMLGHGDDFRAWNAEVVVDAAEAIRARRNGRSDQLERLEMHAVAVRRYCE